MKSARFASPNRCMSLNRRNPGLNNPPTDASPQQSQWMEQITTAMRDGLGQGRTADGKWLTWADLEAEKVVVKSATPGGGYDPGVPPEDPPDTTPPPRLEEVEARGGMTFNYITWSSPNLDYGHRIEVHRSAEDVLSTAVLIGTTISTIYSDTVGSDTTLYYYWVRIVKQTSIGEVIGPWHDTYGVFAASSPDPDWILEDLEGKISDSHLNDALNSEIDKIPKLEIDLDNLEEGLHTETTERKTEDASIHGRIDTNVSRIDDNAAAIVTESQTRATEDEALASQITTLAAEVGDNAAAIQTESQVRASEDAALASQMTQLQAEVDGEFATIRDEMQVVIDDQQALASRVSTVELDLKEGFGAIEQQFKVVEDELEGIRAEYTVKLDVDGYVGGFGLVNDGKTITALWRVDVFGVGAPGSEELTFGIDTETNRVVMDGAFIKTATITDAQIGSMSVDKLVGDTAEFVNANIAEGSITNAMIGNVIQSENYQAGKAGWILNKAGFFECFSIFARGTVEGSIIRGSVIEGGLIIDSGTNITKPTEADMGAGTIRFLCLVDYSYAYAEDNITEAQFLIPSAGYMGDGYDEWGDGQTTEPVYNNFYRNINNTINPTIIFNSETNYSWRPYCPSPSASSGSDFEFTLKIYGITSSGKALLIRTINTTVKPGDGSNTIIPEGVIKYGTRSSTIRCHTTDGRPYDTYISANNQFNMILETPVDYRGDYRYLKFVASREGNISITDENINYL